MHATLGLDVNTITCVTKRLMTRTGFEIAHVGIKAEGVEVRVVLVWVWIKGLIWKNRIPLSMFPNGWLANSCDKTNMLNGGLSKNTV